MNTIKTKQTYITPQIDRIQLDNEISLVLMSGDTNPGDPGAYLRTPDYFNNDPFKDQQC